MSAAEARWPALCRVALGVYLAWHFAALLPYAGELFSREGILPDARLSPIAGAFPNVLVLFDAPAVATGLVVCGAVAGLALALGVAGRAAALTAWYVLACLLGRNPLIANPSLPFVGWVLLALALSPRARGQPLGLGRWLRASLWVIVAAGYTYSGVTKLASPSWIDGTAILRVVEGPLGRAGALADIALVAPSALWTALTWGTLLLEVAFAPLAVARRTRPFALLAMTGMHVGILGLVAFADLTLGMLCVHLFLVEPRWWVRARGAPDRVAGDGAAVAAAASIESPDAGAPGRGAGAPAATPSDGGGHGRRREARGGVPVGPR